jgi:hypothetical protein
MILDRRYSSSLGILNSDTSDRSSFSHESNSGKEYFSLNNKEASSEIDKMNIDEIQRVENTYTSNSLKYNNSNISSGKKFY